MPRLRCAATNEDLQVLAVRIGKHARGPHGRKRHRIAPKVPQGVCVDVDTACDEIASSADEHDEGSGHAAANAGKPISARSLPEASFLQVETPSDATEIQFVSHTQWSSSSGGPLASDQAVAAVQVIQNERVEQPRRQSHIQSQAQCCEKTHLHLVQKESRLPVKGSHSGNTAKIFKPVTTEAQRCPARRCISHRNTIFVSHAEVRSRSPARSQTGRESSTSSISTCSLPSILQIPLPDDIPQQANQGSTACIERTEPAAPEVAAPLIMCEQPFADLPSELGGVGAVEATFYVEHLRCASGAVPCSVCGQSFAAGQLRLGYLPGGSAADGGSMAERWLHVPLCVTSDRFEVHVRNDLIAFGPGLRNCEKHRVLRALQEVAASDSRGLSEPPTRRPKLWTQGPSQVPWWTIELFVPPSPIGETMQGPPSASALEARTALRETTQLLHGRASSSSRPPAASGEAFSRPLRTEPSHRPVRNEQQQQGVSDAASRRVAMLRVIAKLEKLSASATEPCVICREPLQTREKIRRLPCMHIFHQACIERWFRVKATCPLDNIKLSQLVAAQRQVHRGEILQTEAIGSSRPA